MSLSIPAAIALSTGFAEEACTRTSTSLAPGAGAGRSSRAAGGVPNASSVTPFIRFVAIPGSYPIDNDRRRYSFGAMTGEGVLGERAASDGLLLALLGQRAMRELRAAHAATDLSPRQFHLLGLLHDRGALTQRELGSLMHIDPSKLVTLLNPLEADGYLSREREPADRRRHVVSITAAGRAISTAPPRRSAKPRRGCSPASTPISGHSSAPGCARWPGASRPSGDLPSSS